MNNPFHHKVNAPSYKQGFALLITLSVLTVVIALTAVMMGYLDTARKEASQTKALIQANLYFADIKKVLTSKGNAQALYSTLYRTPIFLQSDKGDFSLSMRCLPLDNGVNINWLGQGNNPKMQAQYLAAQKVFDTLMQYYDIQDPSLLEEMLLQSIMKHTEDSDVDRQSRFHQNHGIISYQQFTDIIQRYQLEADDPNIGRIKWHEYFVFVPMPRKSKDNVMSADYLSVALLSILFDLEEASIREVWTGSQGALKKLSSEFGIEYDSKLFTSKFTNMSGCEVAYPYQHDKYRFRFENIRGEVRNFAFYGKQ